MRKNLLALGCVLALSAQESPFPKPTAHHLAMKAKDGSFVKNMEMDYTRVK